MSQGKTQNEKDKSWIFLVLLAFGLAIVFLSQNPKNKNVGESNSSPVVNDPDRMKRVDSHLKDTAYNVEVDRRQRQIEVYQQLNKLHTTSAQPAYQESKEFSLESDPYMQSLTDELDRSRQAPPDQSTPHEIVQQRLYENEQLQKASDAYREAYAEQFKENARKGGWDIELGPNFEVLSVKKLKEKRAPSLFEEGNRGGSR